VSQLLMQEPYTGSYNYWQTLSSTQQFAISQAFVASGLPFTADNLSKAIGGTKGGGGSKPPPADNTGLFIGLGVLGALLIFYYVKWG